MLKSNIAYLISGILYFIFLVYSIKKRNFSIQQHFFILLFLIYLNILIKITLFPIPYDKRFINYNIVNQYGVHFNFIPFMFIKDLLKDFAMNSRAVFGNIALFMPLGYLMPLIFKKVNNLANAALVGLIFALGVEGSQLVISLILGFNYRSVDIDDLILNTTGTVIGYLIIILMIPLIEKFFDINLEVKPTGKKSVVQSR